MQDMKKRMQMDNIAKVKSTKGFTLVELLVALAVLVIAAAAFVPALTFVTKANRSNYTKMTAGKIAASVVEEIRAMPYDEIGTNGGNPSGLIPQMSSVTVGDTVFQVETQIAWGSAESTVSGTINDIALKRVRVIVRAPGAFSGVVEEAGEINSIVSRESEEALVTKGNLRVYVKNSQEAPYTDSCVDINLTGISPTPAVNQNMKTDSNGQVLFGMLDAGKYMVRARLPEGVTPGQGQRVEDGWIIVEAVQVNDYQTTDVVFYMDKDGSFSRLSIRLVKEGDEDGAPIISDGSLSLNWQNEDSNTIIIDNKDFAVSDFIEDKLPQSFFGPLWSTGSYTLMIRNVDGYADYDMGMGTSAKPLLPDGTEWNGSLLPNQALELRVPMNAGAGHYYIEDIAADFEDAALLENLRIIDEGNGKIVLGESAAQVDLISLVEFGGIIVSSTDKNHRVEDICDGDANTYWLANNNSYPQQITWDFGTDVRVTSVDILAKEWDFWGNSHVPKNFYLECSSSESDWTTVLGNSTLANYTDSFQRFNLTNPQSARYFRLSITSRYSPNRKVAVNEIKMYGAEGYASSGIRISKGRQFDYRSEFASAPQFRISWDATTDEDTSVRVYTALTDNNVMPAESRFAEAVNGGDIPNIVVGSDIRGKYLWIMQRLETNDPAKTPSLDWLAIDY